ncbi:hypothetical protein H7X65_02045 [Candidatus Parcubacteria bacterium]|nr:hypothetical protein [Candidatus Parcubacteria bacterium]
MQNEPGTGKIIFFKFINFLLNTIKNSQFVNLSIIFIFYIFIFLIISLHFSFSFYEEQSINFLTKFAQYLPDSNFNIDASAYIGYYLFFIFILGLVQECILFGIYKIFKKDFRNTVYKSKKLLFFCITTTMLLIEIAVSVAVKEYWMIVVGAGSYAGLLLLYGIHRFIVNRVSKIQKAINVFY